MLHQIILNIRFNKENLKNNKYKKNFLFNY